MLKPSDVSISLLRFTSGLMLLYFHGVNKVKSALNYLINGYEWKFLYTVMDIGFPFPVLFALLATIVESFGAILFAFGLLTRYSAIFISITMSVAIYRHLTTDFRFELATLYLVVALVFIFEGGRGLSLDRLIYGKR